MHHFHGLNNAWLLPGDTALTLRHLKKHCSGGYPTRHDRAQSDLANHWRAREADTTQAKMAARKWEEMLTCAPAARVMLSISGYDDDPRGLWEFEEVRRFVQQFARFAGINDAMNERLEDDSMAMLATCGVPCSAVVIEPPRTTVH